LELVARESHFDFWQTQERLGLPYRIQRSD
jgi:hypothetical protein